MSSIPSMPDPSAAPSPCIVTDSWHDSVVVIRCVGDLDMLTIGALGQHPNITKIGGIVGLVTAGFAWYASFATVTNDTWKRTLLPTFPARR